MWRHSRREAFTNRSSSAPQCRQSVTPQRWRDVPCPTVGSFMVTNRLEEVLMGVVPSDLPLNQFCALKEDDLRTKFNVDDPEKIKCVMTVIQLAKEFENSSHVSFKEWFKLVNNNLIDKHVSELLRIHTINMSVLTCYIYISVCIEVYS